MENDLSEASFDVVSSVGPSFVSRREATVRAITNMIAVADDPETRQVLTSMAMMNMEGEGIDDVREYFRKKLVQLGVLKPTEEEAQQMMAAMEGQPQDPNAIFLQAAAEEAVAKAAKARADTVETVASAELKRAQTVETLSKVDMQEQKQAMEAAQMLGGMIQQSAAPITQ